MDRALDGLFYVRGVFRSRDVVAGGFFFVVVFVVFVVFVESRTIENDPQQYHDYE